MLAAFLCCAATSALVAHQSLLRPVPQRNADHAARMLEGAMRTEAAVEVRTAGSKGMGVFAKEPIAAGAWVGKYEGTLTTSEETMARYGSDLPSASYVFSVDPDRDLSIDAQNSTHFSRFFNHAEHGNLRVEVDVDLLHVDFFADSNIGVGEEMCFDYGVEYWMYREPPADDSRDFTAPCYRERPPELTLLHPPPLGTVLPLIPLTARELQAALILPHLESRCALLRSLEYFGSTRLDGSTDDTEMWEVRFGVREGARQEVVAVGQRESFARLQDAALACVVEAVLRPQQDGDMLAREFEACMAQASGQP